jgi:putative peptide zinc metalloprotease protein
MLQLRPTFSESWYRVKDLKAKLRPSAQISRQYYRGERWYVVRDPAGNQFHRLSDAAYRFVGLLDGSRTVGEAWDLVGGQLADDAPTQPEVIQILSQLHSANLVETDVSADAMVLLRRHKMQVQRKMQGRLMNVMFPRIPLWDCDAFLKRWMPLVRPFLSWWGAVLWLGVVIASLVVLGPRFREFQADFSNAISPSNWGWLWLVFVLLKFVHELGHAFACRRFGGEVHEMGIMFLVFIPTPYVDASSAWAFPSRWARMFVGAAGMVIELFVAALCVFAWAYTNPNSLTHHLAFNAILWAGVTTVIFNANPLLRYDGYYMLSDFLEIPNLQQKSKDYMWGLIKRHVFRVKHNQPLPPPFQRVQLLTYAILSGIYRVFVGFMIILVVWGQVPILGQLMAIAGLITWLVVPIVKTFKYLALDAELHRKRGRATAFVVGVAAAIVGAIGLIPVWVYVSAVGVVEPQDREVLYAAVPGFVEEIHVKDGQWLEQGQLILVARDPDLSQQIEQVQARLAETRLRERQAGASPETQAERQMLARQILLHEQNLADLRRRENELTVRAPIAGRLIAPEINSFPGRYLDRGTEIATVATLDRLEVRAVLDQAEAQLAPDGTPTEVRLAGLHGTTLIGRDMRRLPGAQSQLPSPSLTHAAGEQYAADPKDPSGVRPTSEQFELRVRLANPEGLVYPGQRAYIRMKVDRKPLIWQWTRRLLQLVESTRSQWL